MERERGPRKRGGRSFSRFPRDSNDRTGRRYRRNRGAPAGASGVCFPLSKVAASLQDPDDRRARPRDGAEHDRSAKRETERAVKQEKTRHGESPVDQHVDVDEGAAENERGGEDEGARAALPRVEERDHDRQPEEDQGKMLAVRDRSEELSSDPPLEHEEERERERDVSGPGRSAAANAAKPRKPTGATAAGSHRQSSSASTRASVAAPARNG